MQHMDEPYVASLMERLRAIPEDATPRWGSMTRDQLIRHLIWLVRHSMDRSKAVPFMGNWFTVRVLAPLMVRGWLPMPKNLKMPALMLRASQQEQGDLETLHALLEDYLAQVQEGSLAPAAHPIFGDIGVDGWEQVHLRHFEHHLRQFGV